MADEEQYSVLYWPKLFYSMLLILAYPTQFCTTLEEKKKERKKERKRKNMNGEINK